MAMESTAPKSSMVRLLIGLMIFALLVSVKTIIMGNLEKLGFSYFQSNSIRETWSAFSLEYVFLLVSLLISLTAALKFSIKV